MKVFPFRSKRAAETKRLLVDFSDSLALDDQLLASPTAAEKTTSHLTITSVEAIMPEDLDEEVTPVGTRKTIVSMLVAGGTAGNDYSIDITTTTDEGQTLVKRHTFRVN